MQVPYLFHLNFNVLFSLKELYAAGGRRIGFFGAPPLGCVPSQRTLAGGIERVCVNEYNAAAELFNGKLHTALNQLQTSLPNSKLVYVDIYNPLLDVIQNYRKYGIQSSLPLHLLKISVDARMTILLKIIAN